MHNIKLDVFADQSLQQVPQFVENVSNVEDARLQGLLPRESQQLPHEIGGAVRILFYLHNIGEGWVARRRVQQQQIAEPDHRRQQIVEIVRDPASELADRLHLLRL